MKSPPLYKAGRLNYINLCRHEGGELKKLRLALAQINPTVGDLSGNTRKIKSFIRRARAKKADIVAFPELAVTGYPPEDLVLKPQFIQDNLACIEDIARASSGIMTVAGFCDSNHGIYNAAAVMTEGRIIDVYHKMHLPNYGVFDEYRYFRPGHRCPVYKMGRIRIGVSVCEDIWHPRTPIRNQAFHGAELIININASPYHHGKYTLRVEHVSEVARKYGVTIAYVNMAGGQDELIFDGGSFVVDPEGDILASAVQFDEAIVFVDLHLKKRRRKKGDADEIGVHGPGSSVIVNVPYRPADEERPGFRKATVHPLEWEEEIYSALRLGISDYVRKNGFSGVVIGISGGVDSALVATVAADALGSENVHGLFMPSRYTSEESREDSHELARSLGMKLTEVPIDDIFRVYLDTLSMHFRGREPDITEENLQARIRGNILMAFSNKFGRLVLTTGNKSEMSVGYATLYGDMAGGFAVIKDVPKTMVYDLCRWRNRKAGRALIPERILFKEPSAELKPDQRDTDSLPPYPVLDPVLKAYVEDDLSFSEILRMGCDAECARRVVSMVDHSEYKRRQAPPGIKITQRAFGKDRRFPITNRYKSY
jgi:NAD+ synthase (glutamine-hydrolysing)